MLSFICHPTIHTHTKRMTPEQDFTFESHISDLLSMYNRLTSHPAHESEALEAINQALGVFMLSRTKRKYDARRKNGLRLCSAHPISLVRDENPKSGGASRWKQGVHQVTLKDTLFFTELAVKYSSSPLRAP